MSGLKKVFAVAAVAGCFVGTQAFIHYEAKNAPKSPEVVAAVTSSMRAEIAEAHGPLPAGKVLSWGVPGSSMRLMGTATVRDQEVDGCYDMNVQTNLKTPWTSEATFKICP